jgi:hypothetical protein
MVDVGLPEPTVLETLADLSGSLTEADVACLRSRGVSPAIVAGAAANAASPPRTPTRVPEAAPTGHEVASPASPGRAPPAPAPAATARPTSSGRPAVGAAAAPRGIGCGEVKAMLAAKVPLDAVRLAVIDSGGMSDGTVEECVATISKPVAPAAPSSKIDQRFACLADSDVLAAELQPDVAFAQRAVAAGDLAAGTRACNMVWQELQALNLTPATTPQQEEFRIALRKSWTATCAAASSGAYGQALACVNTSLPLLGQTGRPGSEEELFQRVREVQEIAAELARAPGEVTADQTPLLLAHVGTLGLALSEPSPGGDSARRAQGFRESLYSHDWNAAITTLDAEARGGQHGAEARVLRAAADTRGGVDAATNAAVVADTWGDMGVVRSRAWLPWLYAADSLARSCTPFALPEAGGADRLMGLASAVPLAGATLSCLDRSLRYFDAQPMASAFELFEQAAGFDPSSETAPRDRLQSTRSMMVKIHQDNRIAVESARQTAEALLKQAKEKLPQPAVVKFEKSLEEAPARCARAAVLVPLIQEEISRFDGVVAGVDAMERKLAWHDPDLTAALTTDRRTLASALSSAERDRDSTCLGAAKKAMKGAVSP